jgi:hypothetical protein
VYSSDLCHGKEFSLIIIKGCETLLDYTYLKKINIITVLNKL